MRILVLLAFSILPVGAYLAAEAVFVWDAPRFVALSPPVHDRSEHLARACAGIAGGP